MFILVGGGGGGYNSGGYGGSGGGGYSGGGYSGGGYSGGGGGYSGGGGGYGGKETCQSAASDIDRFRQVEAIKGKAEVTKATKVTDRIPWSDYTAAHCCISRRWRRL